MLLHFKFFVRPIPSHSDTFLIVFLYRPSASLFLQVLNIVEKLRTEKSASAVFSFLKTTLAKTFPQPGEKLSIRTFEGDVHELERSANDYLLDLVSNFFFYYIY